MKSRLILALAFTLLSIAFLAACAARARITPISNLFLEDIDTTKKLENLPFDHAWIWNKVPSGTITSIVVNPVRLDRLPPDAWKASMSTFIGSKETFLEDAAALAGYFRQQLIEELKSAADGKYTVAETPDPASLILDFAITELEFSHPVSQAGSLAIPVPGAGAVTSSIMTPHAAFALRITAASSGQLIATVADRKFPPTRIVDLNKLTVTSSAREICASWAKELAATIKSGGLGQVGSVGKFRVLPW